MIISIDPGINGAISIITYDRKLILCRDLPTLEARGSKTLNFNECVEILKPYDLTFGIIEDVGAAPEQGVASTFKFGYAAGFLYGLLLTKCNMVKRVKPSVWKPSLGLNSDKRQSICMANEVFPSTEYFKKIKSHNKAESALLGHYLLRTLGR